MITPETFTLNISRKVITSKHKKQETHTVGVQLQSDGKGGANLVAVDDKDQILPSGYLLKIQKEGRIKKHRSVNPTLGFNLDKNGCIEITEG